MLLYIWVMKMASRYKFSAEEMKAIEEKRKENKDKRAEARLKALELQAKGAAAKEAAEATGFSCRPCDAAGGKISGIWSSVL